MFRYAVLFSALLLSGCSSFLGDAPAAPDMSALAPAHADVFVVPNAPVAALDCAPAGANRTITCD